jgi:hypothetical protein
MMNYDLFNDAGGIIRSPGLTLGNLMKEKRWLPAFLLILLVTALYANITLPLKIAEASRYPVMSDFPGEQLIDLQENISMLQRILITSATFLKITLSFIIGAFMVYLFFGVGGSQGFYMHFFTLVVNASIIDTLLPLIRDIFSIVFNTNLGRFSNLIILFPSLKPLSLKFWFILQVDLFYIWYLVAIAAGVAVFAKMSLKKCLFISFLYFLFTSAAAAFSSYLGAKIIASMTAGG